MNYYFWVFRNHDHTIVIDTGFSQQSGVQRRRKPLVDPADALARLDIDPLEVRLLVLTHAHYDHAGNLGLFPNAQILMSRTEFDFWTGEFAQCEQYAHHVEASDIKQLQELAAAGRITFLEERQNTVIPGIEVHELRGHSAGQLAVVVEMPDGPVILASDATHYYEELELNRPFAVVENLTDMYRAYKTIRQWLMRKGAILVPGHDPDVMNRFEPVDSSDPSFAVHIV
jgi:glyoxylase-like metal-dependent hydrolase (beta-lactamase superfamily II)